MDKVLSEFATGGNWLSSNTGVATVDASGHVSGLTAGTSDISYALTNACGTTVQNHTVYVYCPTLEVNNVTANNIISIFPNPAHNFITVKGVDPSTIRVVNMYGQVVKEAHNANSIDIAALANGIYSVQLYNLNGLMVGSQRFVKD